MDLLEAKQRIAEAVVESVLRRARFQVHAFGSDRPPPLRSGREDFAPDRRITSRTGADRDFLIGIKYRRSIEQFIAVENGRADRSVFHEARRLWPGMYLLLVTDRPEAGRSCFQVVSFQQTPPGEAYRAVDLADVRELRIFDRNIEEHEELGLRIFTHLAGEGIEDSERLLSHSRR
jgi:hypothetical protein